MAHLKDPIDRNDRRSFLRRTAGVMTGLALGSPLAEGAEPDRHPLELSGVTVTPHLQLDSMRYRKATEPPVGARIQLFLRVRGTEESTGPLSMGPTTRLLFGGKSPASWLKTGDWAWHDTPAALPSSRIVLPPGAMTVWTINGRSASWGPGARPSLELGPQSRPWISTEIPIVTPACWQSAVTFLAPAGKLQPEQMVVHLANRSAEPVKIVSCRLWLATGAGEPRVLFPQAPLTKLAPFGGRPTIPAGQKGGFTVETGPLPLSYGAVEIVLEGAKGEQLTTWSHLRIRPERFDISGGWVNNRRNGLVHEPFLKALHWMHVNTAHYGPTEGYTGTELARRYPIKYFNKLDPIEQFDREDVLPQIHAVEFLGEPQYGGGRPVPPQEVWEQLAPYAASRLATTLTHSEERIWRDYAGLSDYPHYDAYRVTAPSADAWRLYDRWGGERIGWGSPLETIGDMCRSLRELNRPMACAYWSQGPHEGWDVYDGRQRTSPTPAEIRLQAWHALSTRITSLYWFNLSLRTLVEWRDTLAELNRLGREMRMIDELLLEGDADHHERRRTGEGRLDWDLSTVCGPRGALLFALDLDYRPRKEEKVFAFGPPREARWTYPLPDYLRGRIVDLFRLDADGLHEARWRSVDRGVEVTDQATMTAVHVATPLAGMRGMLERKHRELLAKEAALDFNPARRDQDFAQLVEAFRQTQR